LGIDRRTVQRWHKHDPEFQEALHDAKQEAVLSSRQTLLALAESAVEMVETQLHREQNPRVALAFLRGFGVLAPPKMAIPKVQAAKPENEIRAQSATLESGTTSGGSDSGDASLQEPAEDVLEEVFEWEDLLPAQQQAVGALYDGQSLAATAAISETTAEEIRCWLANDLRFATVLSGLQFERVCKLRHRLCRLTDLAVELVQRGIQAGDSRLAMALLRGLGLMS
jgi:hypothetical protein